jgi:chromosome segregation ATPase
MSNINERSIFVKLDDYKEVLELMNAMKSKLNEAKGVLNEIKKLRDEEATEIELWENSVSEIERKIGFVDKSLFDTEP